MKSRLNTNRRRKKEGRRKEGRKNRIRAEADETESGKMIETFT